MGGPSNDEYRFEVDAGDRPMRWEFSVFRWLRALPGQANAQSENDAPDWQEDASTTLTKEQLLERCQRASRLTC